MKPAVNSLTVTFDVTVAVRETEMILVRRGGETVPSRMFLCDVNIGGETGRVQLGFLLDGMPDWEDWLEADSSLTMRDHLTGEIVKVIMAHHWKDPLEVLAEAEV